MTALQTPAPSSSRATVRCVECDQRGHPLQVIPHSYCEHRTCMRNPCWSRHILTCPAICKAVGRTPDRPHTPAPAAVEQPALFEVA